MYIRQHLKQEPSLTLSGKNKHGKVYAIFGSVEIIVSREVAPNLLQKPTREAYAIFGSVKTVASREEAPNILQKPTREAYATILLTPEIGHPLGGLKQK